MESSTYTVREANDDIDSLDFGSDHWQLKKYIKKRLEKCVIKTIVKLSKPDDDIDSLDFGSDPWQLRKYIKKRLEKCVIKTMVELSKPDISAALNEKL